MASEPIYLDHAATTPLRPEVLQAMLPYFTRHWGNPSSLHGSGRRARQGLDEARESVARSLGAKPREIVFTSGGTESINLAIKGVAWASSARGRHLVTTGVEHKAVMHAHQLMEHFGFGVTYLPVDPQGRVEPAAVANAITEHTSLVSIGYANNEVGTIQPIAEISRITRERGVLLHTDAVQAAAYLPLEVNALGVDLLSLGAHKLHGPKGVGALFIRQGTQLVAQLQGGSQERQRRAGTENVPLIVGLATALELVHASPAERDDEGRRQAELRDRLIAGIGELPGTSLTGHPTQRLPNSASFIIDGVEGGDLVAALDLAGIAASTGSACTSGSTEPSHVLLAMGIDPQRAHGSLRLTLGRATTEQDVERTIAAVAEAVDRLRVAGRPRAAAASA